MIVIIIMILIIMLLIIIVVNTGAWGEAAGLHLPPGRQPPRGPLPGGAVGQRVYIYIYIYI